MAGVIILKRTNYSPEKRGNVISILYYTRLVSQVEN